MSVSERISELRKQKGISQAQLANAMSVSRQAVSKWETGQSLPDSLNLIRLADILDTNIEYLTTGRNIVPSRPPVIIKTVEIVEKVEDTRMPDVSPTPPPPAPEPIIQYVDRPVIKHTIRTRYVRNPIEFILIGLLCFILGIIIGLCI